MALLEVDPVPDEDERAFPDVEEVGTIRFGMVTKAYNFSTGELVELEKPALDYVATLRNDEAVFSSDTFDHVVRALDVFKSKVEVQYGNIIIKFPEGGMWRSIEEWRNCFIVRVFNCVAKDSMHT